MIDRAKEFADYRFRGSQGDLGADHVFRQTGISSRILRFWEDITTRMLDADNWNETRRIRLLQGVHVEAGREWILVRSVVLGCLLYARGFHHIFSEFGSISLAISESRSAKRVPVA